jgi:hypothetical protein
MASCRADRLSDRHEDRRLLLPLVHRLDQAGKTPSALIPKGAAIGGHLLHRLDERGRGIR